MKGKLEDYIANVNFERYAIFRPGPLVRKDSDRLGEKIAVKVIRILNGIGLFKKFKPLETSLLAKKLIKAPKVLSSGTTIVELDKIFDF